jgi:hypothetical protein
MRPATLSSRQGRLWQNIRRMWLVLDFAAKKFADIDNIDGVQLAGAFAFNASPP